MANDVNANIRINIDSADALSQLRLLQTQISNFNKSVVQTNSAAVAKQRDLLTTLQAQVGATKQFSTSIVNVESSVSRLGRAIDKNKLSLGEYFRFGIASSRRFGKVFSKEHALMTQLATERVKKLQTQYVALGAAQSGVTKAMAIRPLQLFNADAAIAIQRTQLFNKLLRDGSTSLVNFGKNTQWAGRQLMVGFTVPLTIFGGAASKVFMDLEEQAINFRKVYGDIFTVEEEVEENLSAVKELSEEFTKYGIAAKDTLALAGVAAQSGQRGQELMEATTEATRLGVLGQMEQTEAMKTVITLQNAFKLSSEELTNSINFLNVVENQSVLSLQDVAGAIPRVAPVIYSLGGNVQDLAAMLVAMREGGVSAAEGANALKTSLSRLISPTAGAVSMAKKLGIDLNAIVESNQGDIMGAVIELAESMERLDGLSKQRLLSEVFGKRQYARVGALFNNITNSASQAQKVIGLTAMSTEELAETTERELSAVSDSISTKFTGAIERLKIQLAPIGELFLQIATPVIEFATKAVAKFNELSPGVRKFATIATIALGVVTPVLIMLVGLLANFIGNMVKGVSVALNFINRARGAGDAVNYLSDEQLEATAAAASLEGRTETLTNALNVQRSSVLNLARAYQTYVGSASMAAAGLPRGFRGPVRRMAKGGMVGGQGNKDSEPALLMPGEFVMNKEATEKYGPILGAMNQGNIKGYADGSQFAHIGGGQKIGLVDLRSLMQGLPDAFTKGAQRFVNILAGTFGNAVKAIVLPSLGFMTSGSINRRMDKPGKSPVTKGEFLADWDKRGLDRWSQSLNRAGLKMEDVQDDLTILDTAMRGQISSMEEGAVINDRVMKDIYDEASKTLPAQSRLRKEFDRLSATFKEVRVNLRKSMVAAAGLPIQKVGSKEKTVIGGRSFKIQGDKSGFTKAGTGVTQAQLIRGGAVGSVLGESMDGGARTSVGAASPAKDGQKLVNDYVEGMEAGARANVAEARQSGAMVKGAFLSGAAGGAGIIGAAATQAGGEAGGGGMGVIPMGAPLMGDDQPKGPRSDINTRKELPGDVDKASDSVDDLDKKGRKAGKGLMGLVMAMTMVAGSASMMEGKIGETAQSLFPLMMGLDALMIPLMMMGGGGGGLLSGVAGGLGAVGGAGAAAAAGVAAIVALIVAAVAAFAMAIKRSESFRQVFVDLFNTLKEAVSPFTRSMEELGEKSGSILGYISNLWNTAVGVVAANVSVVVKGIEIVVKILTMARNVFWGLIGVIVNFVGSLGPVGAAIKNTFEGFRNFFANIPQLARQALLNVTKFIDKMVNNAIDGLNKLINAYNEVASRLGVDTIKPIENINLTVTVLQATGMRGSGSDVLANRELEKQEAKETARDSFRQTPLPPEEPDPEGTGGSKEKSFLEKLKEDLAANAKLYLDAEKGLKGYMKNRGKFLGAFQKLRNRGLSEDIISSLGTGPEGLKNAKELLKKNREQIKKLSEASRLASLGETVESLRREKEKTKEKTAAAKATEGLSPELQDIVMNNEQFISSFAKVKVGSKEYNKLVKEVQKLANAKRKLAEETQTEFEAQEQATKAMIDSLELQIKKNEDDLINAFEKTHGMLPEMMELEISKREESIRVIQKQIDELEELNEIDQERIEGLSRQKEMLERQIEVLDRANEMDQRRIELLNRQDEIRSRESKALSKELDDMSKIEQELRDSHEKRVEQLEKVADVNDYILNQQKQQLNISRAISEGDIYSATAAAQEMRAGSAAFSERQLISGLEAGLENQVSNLRTSDGLTRDQAERQIANIKEQSYQTSLQIRQIEDMIYQRNQQMIPLKDQQYSLDMQIRDIEDLIYDRNVQKKQIFDEQIDPLQTQNNLQNEYLRKLNIEIDHVNGPLKAKQNHLDRILELEGASQKVTGEIRDMTIKARKKADELSGSWDGVTKSIVSALGALSQFNGAKAAKSYAGGTVKSYAGGIVEGYSKGGKIKGYSVGGVAGNGSRDSVPAMLTPGEFVIRKAMVNKYGQSMMHDINMGSFSMPGYGAPGRSSNVSPADVSVSNISSINAPVYNVYDMNFSINGSNQSADEIANRVMVKMRQLQSHNIRSNRGN